MNGPVPIGLKLNCSLYFRQTRRRHDRAKVHGDRRQERGERRLQLEANLVVVDLLDGLDDVDQAGAVPVLVRAPHVREGMLRIQLPQEADQHGIGIEGRAIVKLDVMPQGERVFLAVVRDLPLLGQPGADLDAGRKKRDQRVVDVAAHVERLAVVLVRRVQPDAVAAAREDHDPFGMGSFFFRPGARGKPGQRRTKRQRKAQRQDAAAGRSRVVATSLPEHERTSCIAIRSRGRAAAVTQGSAIHQSTSHFTPS